MERLLEIENALEKTVTRMNDICDAYEEACEYDYGQIGEFEGCRPDEIVNSLVRYIRNLQPKIKE